MFTLEQCQHLFAAGLKSSNTDILNLITPHSVSAAHEFAIYQNSVIGLKQKSLQTIYAVCHRLVGTEFFIAMITEYIQQTPSRSADLAHYGATLAEFIEHFIPAKSLPYLPDVARLEWAWHRLYSHRFTAPLDFQKLQLRYQENNSDIIFILGDHCTLLQSIYPVHQIWEVNQPTYAGDQTVILEDSQGFFYLIWCKELVNHINSLEKPVWQLLFYISQQWRLEDIYQALIEEFPDIDFSLLLSHVIDQGWVIDFR